MKHVLNEIPRWATDGAMMQQNPGRVAGIAKAKLEAVDSCLKEACSKEEAVDSCLKGACSKEEAVDSCLKGACSKEEAFDSCLKGASANVFQRIYN